jgi:hypothetical protein
MADRERKNSPLPATAIFQPWELMGESRRDCESHRAKTLATLAYLGLVLGGLSFLLLLPGLVGIPLAVRRRVTWLSGNDRSKNWP